MPIEISTVFFLPGLKYSGPTINKQEGERHTINIDSSHNSIETRKYAISLHNGQSTIATFGVKGAPKTTLAQTHTRLADFLSQLDGMLVEIVSIYPCYAQLLPAQGKETNPKGTPAKYNAHTVTYGRKAEYDFGFLSEETKSIQEKCKVEQSRLLSKIILNFKYNNKILAPVSSTVLHHEGMSITLGGIDVRVSGDSTYHIDTPSQLVESKTFNSDLVKYVDGILLCNAFGKEADTAFGRFMSAWIVLEKFINKYFSKLSDEQIVEAVSTCMESMNEQNQTQYVLFPQKTSRKIFKLSDKFIICSHCAGSPDIEGLITRFKSIKAIRDSIHYNFSEKGEYFPHKVIELLQEIISGDPLVPLKNTPKLN